MPFSRPHIVRFHEVDGANILYFTRMLEICHCAFEDWLVAYGLPLREIFETRPWKLPVVHAEVDFVSPMRLGDALEVQVDVARVGTGSITWAFEVRGDDGGVRARVQHVHAAIDAATFAPRALPDEVRAAARAAQEG